ncbi:hypothetical protein GALL_192200 [mine drainage metagenome]|uniref:Uncharacterized protein n=1 Tax=mine drainage metagenome TaxID=410659 RepID=A0A1J5S3K2_9ZZZZ
MSGDFDRLYAGRLWSVMSWDGLAAFWNRVDPAGAWYLYAVGEPPPASPASEEDTAEFLRRIDELLRREHHESYCGIVYADDLERPSFVKIYDPNHLGSSCGSGRHPPPLPGWIMSRVPPTDLQASRSAPEGRRRWWRTLFPGAETNTEQ